MKKIDVIIPTFRSDSLTMITIKSFELFSGDYDFRYIVVNTDTNNEGREKIQRLFPEKIIWIDVENIPSFFDIGTGSVANAAAIEVGLKEVNTELVFICHNDVMATKINWLDQLFKQISEETPVASFVRDNVRIMASHVNGLLVKTELARNVSMMPVYKDQTMLKDVGDEITAFCRLNNLNNYVCDNTCNNDKLTESLEEPFVSLSGVDRCVDDDGDVIYIHLGRGMLKYSGIYCDERKTNIEQWLELFEIIKGENNEII